MLLLGALEPWKRPDLALEAVALAARAIPELRLRVAGSPLGSEGRRLVERMRRRSAEPDLAGRVEFTGWLDDPRPALRRADCLLHCAETEPFGLALVEALAAGTPVVAPAAGGPLEIVDSSCGVLYAPGQPSAAAAALRQVLAEPERLAAMALGARRRAEQHFDRERLRQRYRELVGEAWPDTAGELPSSALGWS